MTEQEGVIKYRLEHRPSEPHHYPQFPELNAWRAILLRLGLIGQDPARYGGLGFGNISFRDENSTEFVITGSQTGGLAHLCKEHFSRILYADATQNHIISGGAITPSSEALTHAAVYATCPAAKAVVHVHNPEIWRSSRQLALPIINAAIAYGTPAMADAVSALFRNNAFESQAIFVMLGHEDGIVAFGESIAYASQVLIKTLASALTLSNSLKHT